MAEHGVARNLTKAEETGALNFDDPGREEKKIIQRHQKRKALLAALLEQDPNLTSAEVRKALDFHHKYPKHHPGAKHKPVTSPNRGSTLP